MDSDPAVIPVADACAPHGHPPLFLRSRSGAAMLTGVRRGGNLHERLSAVAATRIHRLSPVLLETCSQNMRQEMTVLSVLRKSHVLLRARGGDVVRRDAYMLAMAGDNAGAGRPAPAGRSSGERFSGRRQRVDRLRRSRPHCWRRPKTWGSLRAGRYFQPGSSPGKSQAILN